MTSQPCLVCLLDLESLRARSVPRSRGMGRPEAPLGGLLVLSEGYMGLGGCGAEALKVKWQQDPLGTPHP